MAKQIITVGPDGSLFGLDHKRKGVSLRALGKATTKRATLVEWSEDHQLWFVRWEGQRSNDVWTNSTLRDAGVHECEADVFLVDEGIQPSGEPIAFWNDYEDAVTTEVAVIQSLQTSGSYAA